MGTLWTAYAVAGLVAGFGAFLIAGETPPHNRAHVWSMIAAVAALWWVALAYLLWVVAAEAGFLRRLVRVPSR